MQYGLHDTTINKIISNKTGIELYFESGVYLLDEQGRETELSDPCRMVISINRFDSTQMFEHITVTKIRKSKATEMNFSDFLKLVEKNVFEIDMDYYSFFGHSILLKGYCGQYGIELTITEIEKAEYRFD